MAVFLIDELSVFGFTVERNFDLVTGSDEGDCGSRESIGLNVSCGEDTVSSPTGGEALVCGGIFRNALTWIPTTEWICSDLILPTVWYISPE